MICSSHQKMVELTGGNSAVTLPLALTKTKDYFVMADSRICSVPNCGKVHRAKGFCSPHYSRWKAHGDPLCGGTSLGEAASFLESVVMAFQGDECLIWPYSKSSGGYGFIKYGGKMRRVHRIVCEREQGPAPTSIHQAAHLCGNGHLGCVNRRHLAWKTPVENVADKMTHGTLRRGENHGRAKLTDAQVMEIRDSVLSVPQLAKGYGVAKSTISNIKARRAWVWLPTQPASP